MSSTGSSIGYELSRTFAASPEALFDALTSAKVLKRIWSVQEIEVDARVGGKTSAIYVLDGQDWSFTISYSDLARNLGRLAWTVQFKSSPSKEIRVVVQLTRVNGGTAMRLGMDNFESTAECSANRQAWERGLAILAEIIEEQVGQ